MKQIKIIDSARRHGISDADILHIVKEPVYRIIIEEYQNKLLLVGFDIANRQLEVVTIEEVDDIIIVIHAMKARKSTQKFIEEYYYGR